MQTSCDQQIPAHLFGSLVALAFFAALAQTPEAHATTLAVPAVAEFDVEAIKARGIDPSLAELFRHAPRFMPGKNPVMLTVNGKGRGKIIAMFDEHGSLCADEDFQKQAGLIAAPGFSEQTACFDLHSAWPQTELNLDPGEGRIDLVLPAQAVAIEGADEGNWAHGGMAGLFNYDARYMDYAGGTAGVQYMQLGSEAGLNIDDWIIRSRQTFTRFDGKDQLQHQGAYAQRTFIESRQVLQAGRINFSNSMFGIGQVLGLQAFPEAALSTNRSGPALVEGIADSQSVVEVRQAGALVHSTTVPAGPFRLQHFQLLNSRDDLQVSITGSHGEQRTFAVPAATLQLGSNRVTPGLSLGIGKLNQNGDTASPLVGVVANGWRLSPRTTANAGLLGSAPYQAAAVSLDTQPYKRATLSLQSTLSRDSQHALTGAFLSAAMTHDLSKRISLTTHVSQQSADYRGLSDALRPADFDKAMQRSFGQLGAGLSGSTDSLGTLSLSMTRSAAFDGDARHYVRGGWNKKFGQANIGVRLEHDMANSTNDAARRLYLTVNVPLGQRSISSYLNSSNNGHRTGARYSDRTQPDRGWSLSTDHDMHSRHTSTGLSADWAAPISQLSGSMSRDSSDHTSWSLAASGGAVVHDNGITLSSRGIGDTFGIVRVGDEGGVKLDTPSGPVWTDRKGHAVLPTLNSYKRSSIQVDTRSLAKNVDIDNAYQETDAARGSVSILDFSVVRTRRVLATVKDNDGNYLPYGATLFDRSGSFVTVAGEQGKVFIPDASHEDEIVVQSSGRTLCTFRLDLPPISDTNALYETAHAQCL